MKIATRQDGGSFTTREGWLTALTKSLEPVVKQRTGLGRKPYRIACGWPSRKGTSHNHRRFGECWNTAEHTTKEMFISPTLDDVDEIASTVAHELLHAFLPPGVGHRKQFSQAAKKLGLVGKPRDCGAGEELAAVLRQMTDKLGPYPHERIEVDGPKDRCRNLKYQCAGCGYIGRSSAYWLDNFGPPICPVCDAQMVQGDDIDNEDTLEIVSNVTEMRIPGDDRFRIMRSLNGKKATWTVIDYEVEDPSLFSSLTLDMLRPGAMMPVRHTPAESRENALEIIDGIRSGLTTYDMLEASWEDRVEDVDVEYLGDEEDEEPDYPEDQDVKGSELAEVESRRRTALEQMKVAA